MRPQSNQVPLGTAETAFPDLFAVDLDGQALASARDHDIKRPPGGDRSGRLVRGHSGTKRRPLHEQLPSVAVEADVVVAQHQRGRGSLQFRKLSRACTRKSPPAGNLSA